MSRALRSALARGPVVSATAYDVVAARLVSAAGFDAVFSSGYGLAASSLGKPDTGQLTLDLVEERVAGMAAAVRVPVLADADDGWGDVAQAVRRLGEAGASAVMIEDQIPDKRCGHVAGKQVVGTHVMAERVRAAADAGSDAGTVLIARTDARAVHGLSEALARGLTYAEAGADVVFVEAPESVEELAVIPQELPCPAMVNVLPGGRTPLLPVEELAAMGFALIVFGLVDLMIASKALERSLSVLRRTGTVEAIEGDLTGFAQLNALTGLEDVVRRGIEDTHGQ